MHDPSQDESGTLRASKKAKTRSHILASAIALFERGGIRATRSSAIAQHADVSAGTLFNYFPTKSALAEAWVRGEVDRVLAERLSGLGDHGLRSGLRLVCRELASSVLAPVGLREEAWRTTGRARAGGLDAEAPLVAAIRGEQERERVRRDLSAVALAEMLMDAIERGVISALREGASGASAVRVLQARVDLVLDGARKRNERVAAPLPTGATRPGRSR